MRSIMETPRSGLRMLNPQASVGGKRMILPCLPKHQLFFLVSLLFISPVVSQTFRCFLPDDNQELIRAVGDYIATAGSKASSLNDSSARLLYGWNISNWCVDRLEVFDRTFHERTSFNEPLDHWNTSSATSMAQMFYDCHEFNQHLGHFDTSRVTNMDQMFLRAKSFEGLGLDSWNVGSVESLNMTFRESNVNVDISAWDVRNVHNLYETFGYASGFNKSLCAWRPQLDMSKISEQGQQLYNTFVGSGCAEQGNISLGNPSRGSLCHECVLFETSAFKMVNPQLRRVTEIALLPQAQNSNKPLVNEPVRILQESGQQIGSDCFDPDGDALRSAVPIYVNTIQKLPTLQQRLNHAFSIKWGYPIGVWCVSRVVNFARVFQNQTSFNEPLYWNMSSARRTDMMFMNAQQFNQNLSHFNTKNVYDMTSMFKQAQSFEGIGLEKWDTSFVTQMREQFALASKFNGNIAAWNVGRVTNMKLMFKDATKFNRDISKWNVFRVVDMASMFSYASAFDKNLCAWGKLLSNRTNVNLMFENTACPFGGSATLFKYAPAGPFCHDCCCRPTLMSSIEGLFEVPLIPAAVATLKDGKILAWSSSQRYRYAIDSPIKGGSSYTTVFNPVDKSSTDKYVIVTKHNMFCPGISTLPRGRILITGGLTSRKSSIYNPNNDTWTIGAEMNIGRGYHSQVTLHNGQAFVFGGSWGPGGRDNKFGEVYSEDALGGRWTIKSNITTISSAVTKDVSGIYRADNHMWLFEKAPGRILLAGPAKQMHWITLTGSGSVIPTTFRGDDNDAMNGGAVLYDINKIFTVGGSPNYDNGVASARAYIIDMSGSEPVTQRQPDMTWPRSLISVVVLPNGWIVCAGGQSVVKLFSSTNAVLPIEIFDPFAKRFHELRQPLSTPRIYHSVAVLMKDGRVAIGGGGLCGEKCDYYTSFNHPNFELLSPPYLFDSSGQRATRPVILSVTSKQPYTPYTVKPGQTLIVKMNTEASHTFSLVKTGSATHSLNLDQRRVPLTASKNGATFTLVVPSSPVHVPPGTYWLFAMNDKGVPSNGYTLNRL